MNVQEIAQFCCETVGDISSEMLDFAKRAIRLKYSTLYDAHAWRESFRTYSIALDANLNGSFFLPYDAEEIIFLKLSRDGINFSRLQTRERDWIERFGASQYSLPGSIPLYYRAENLAWPYLNPGIFTFTTSSLSPFSLYIEGKDTSGNSVNETFSMSASQSPGGPIVPASVATRNAYQIVTSLSKSGGILTVQDAAGSTPLVMSEANSGLLFSQFVLFPPLIWVDQFGAHIPYSVQTQVKLKADLLDNDMSVPRISHVIDALVEFTLSSLYTKARHLTKADSREQKAIAHVQAAVNIERNQAESFKQAIPTIYERGNYLEGDGVVSSITPFG